jgi:phosphoglycolate phosphatase-like HAD superfamily hydrolase
MKTFREADIKLISMDFDDTLRQTHRTFSALMLELGNFFNLDMDNQKIKGLWGKRPEELTREAFSELEISGIDSWNLWKVFLAKRPENLTLPLFDGVTEALSSFLTNGYNLGIVSNGSAKSIYESIDLHFAELLVNNKYPFAFVHTQEICIKPKPYPEAFDAALIEIERYGIFPENIVHVGDHLDDYKAASARGIYPAVVTTGVLSREDFEYAGIREDIIFSSFKEFAEAILQSHK